MIRGLFFGVLALHGLIHVMGFVKGFGLADLPQLTQPISRALGFVWLFAGLLCLVAAFSGWLWPQGWWLIGFIALVLSQTVIIGSWADAKFGTLINLLLLMAVIHGFAAEGPWGLRAAFRRDAKRVAATGLPSVLTETDLEGLPDVVRRYVRASGMVGQPRVRDFQATWTGRIRSNPESPWMAFTAKQFNTFEVPRRFFLMDARMNGMPVDVYHAFQEAGATMQVRLLSAFTMVDARGADLTRAETVTLFNDLCFFAPGELVSSRITWGPSDARSALAQFTLGPNTVRAELHFNDRNELIDFATEDRLNFAPDGKRFTQMRWTTPVREYAQMGPVRVPAKASVLWHPASGAYAYGEFELIGLSYNKGIQHQR
jgi:hypothetical protein